MEQHESSFAEPVTNCDRTSIDIKNAIIEIRHKLVIIDRDLADLCGMKTKVLNQAVKRKGVSFNNCRFQLSDNEKREFIESHRVNPLKHSRFLPYVYTEDVIKMLPTIIKRKSGDEIDQIVSSLESGFSETRESMRLNSLNFNYWKEMTIYSTVKYCLKMLELSSDYPKIVAEDPEFIKLKEKIRQYVSKVIDYDHEKTIDKHLPELEDECPFPADIQGRLHEYADKGKFQPAHLMSKILTLSDKENAITYEFLIEYGLLEPDVEIYYGIKAISDSEKTTESFFNTVRGISEEWHQKTVTEKKYPRDINYYAKQKFTNNASNGTFWISWMRLDANESFDKVITGLFNKFYKRFLPLESHHSSAIINLSKECLRIRKAKILGILDKNTICASGYKESSPKNKGIDPEDLFEDALKYKDKSTGEKLLIQKGKLYYFNMNKLQSRIFIEYLYNEDYVNGMRGLMEQFSKLDDKTRHDYKGNPKKYLMSMSKFVDIQTYKKEANPEEYEKYCNQYKKDCKEAHNKGKEDYVGLDPSEIEEYRKIIENMDPTKKKERINWRWIIKNCRTKEGGHFDKHDRKSVDKECFNNEMIKSILDILNTQ